MRTNEQFSRFARLIRTLAAGRVARCAAVSLAFVLGGVGSWPARAECDPPATANLPVELIPQENGNWCWAASAQMIMNAVGNDSVSQCEQAALALGKQPCCPDQTACDEPGWPEFWKFGYSASVIPEGTSLAWAQIQDQIACQGKPFIWAYRYPNKCRAHMVVVVGYLTTSQGVRALKCYDPSPTGAGACWYITYEAYANEHFAKHWRHYLDVTKAGPGVPPIPKPECDARRDAAPAVSGAPAGRMPAAHEPVFDCSGLEAAQQPSERPELIGVGRQPSSTGGESRRNQRSQQQTKGEATMKTRIHWIHCGLLASIVSAALLALASDPAPTCCPPDLKAVAVSMNLAAAPAGSCVFVTNVVQNISQTNSAGSSITKIFIVSAETTIEWSQHDLGVLAPGESVTFLSDLQIPPDLPPGNYEIVAECGLEVYESNETNNLAACNLTITAGDPVGCGPGANSDLQVHSVTAPDTANDGDYIPITDVTTNLQNLACSSYSRLWLCPTSSLDTNTCHYWGQHSVSALGPGGSYSVTSNKQIPLGTSGTNHIVVVCGWGGSGCEAIDKRNNNTNTTQIVVQ